MANALTMDHCDEADEMVLKVDDLKVWYGGAKGPVRAIDGVSFTLRAGEVLGLVGESGCGKSTLGRSLLGLLPDGAATAGEATFKGKDVLSVSSSERRAMAGRDMAMIFQEPMTRLNPLMRVGDHFRELLKTHRKALPASAIRQITLDILRQVGIPASRVDQYPHQFSGGMRQRIMIALALVMRPSLVVADEPTTALDVVVEGQILALLKRLKQEIGMSLVLVTHNLGIVVDNCDQIAVMYAGQIAEYGPARSVFSDPQHPYTRGLLASTITQETTELVSIPGSPPDLSTLDAGCRFCPRCPDAMAVCTQRQPPEFSGKDQRRTVCWLKAPAGMLNERDRRPLGKDRISDDQY